MNLMHWQSRMRYIPAMQPMPAWTHPFRFEDGTAEDLMRVIDRSIFYHMQHPILLDLFVEPTASLRCRLHGDGALLIIDVNDQALRIQRPLGQGSNGLFEDEVRASYGKKGIFVAGLDTTHAGWVKSNCPKARPPIEQFVEFSDMTNWDADLRGTQYKTLRSALHRADREGVRVEAYDPAKHLTAAMRVFEEWNGVKPRTATYWMPHLLERAPTIPGLVGVAALDDTGFMGVTFALTAGSYAYMLMAIARKNHGRSQEAMDFDLMNRLKASGVLRLDWGVSDGGTVSAFKRKYGEILREPISTFWMPV